MEIQRLSLPGLGLSQRKQESTQPWTLLDGALCQCQAVSKVKETFGEEFSKEGKGLAQGGALLDQAPVVHLSPSPVWQNS